MILRVKKWLVILPALSIVILACANVVVTDTTGAKSSASPPIKEAINHPPVIDGNLKVSPSTRVSPGRTCTVECLAKDPDNDELSYVWSASKGKISTGGTIATWVAPDCDGTYDITVVVKDAKGGEATQAVQIQVEGG